MVSGGRSVRALAIASVAAVALVAVSGADAPDPNAGGPYPYPAVSPLTAPTLPSWIVQVLPVGQVEPLSQIRIRFAGPMIPLEALESRDEQSKLSYFEITPALRGTWRFVTPHMAIFEANRALPKATRVRVKLKAGLSGLAGHRLQSDLAWTFNTEPLTIATPPGNADINPTYEIDTNAAVDMAGLRVRTRLWDESSGFSVPITVEPRPSSSPRNPRPFLERVVAPQEIFQEYDAGAAYNIKPLHTLRKNTGYRLTIAPGVAPLHGNMPTTVGSVAEYHTYAPLAFEQSERVGGAAERWRASARFYGGTLMLDFNNPLAEKSARANIAVSPAPASGNGAPDLFEGITEKVVLNPWALKPNTRYTVTIKGGLTDTWHQTLGKTVTLTFATDDIAADFSTLDGWRVFPATLRLKLPANVITLPGDMYQAAFKALEPESLVYSAYENMPDYTNWHTSGVPPRGLPPVMQWPDVTMSGTRSKSTLIDVGLAAHLGAPYGVLAYGMTARIPGTLYEMPDSLAVTTGRINVTNLGLFAQVMPHEAVALVHRLSDGAPVGGARVEFFVLRSDGMHGTPVPCATARTDSTGMATLDAASVRGCAPWHETGRNEYASGPRLLAVARSGADWTAATIGANDYISEAFSFGWDDSQVQSRGSLFSDRGLYQPGEKASFEGYAFHLRDGTLQRDDRTLFALTLRHPDGTVQNLGAVSTNDFGTFPFATILPVNADLGDYTLVAKSEDGVELDGPFRVAEFKAPNFKVALSVDKQIAFGGDTVNATGQTDYLFGQPVDGAKTRFTVRRWQTSFVPHGWEDKGFSWDPIWWPQAAPGISSSDVLDVNGLTGKNGATRQPIPVAFDLPFAMAYTAELSTSDASNLVIANSTRFTALPSPVLVGVNADYLTPAGMPLTASILATDPQGALVAGRSIHVSLIRITWDERGTGHLTVEGASDATTTAKGPVKVALVPSSPGWYRVRANFFGAAGRATETDRDVWVYGPGEVTWSYVDDNRRFELTLDRDKYEVGERATVLLKSPFADADLYLAVIRHGTMWRTFSHVTGSAPTVTFEVTRQMLPGAQIEAVLVRRGAPIESLKPGTIKSLARFGSARLTVNLDRRYLKVAVKPMTDRLRPGAMQTVEVQLADYAGNPVRGQITLMVADESVLQLSGYRPPDLVQAVYSDWTTSAVAGDNRLVADFTQPLADALDQARGGYLPEAMRAELASGGPHTTNDVFAARSNSAMVLGKVTLAHAPGAPTRVNFQQLAYFNGDVRTDDQGHATVTFKVPDNLTTWRVLAIAAAATPTDDPADFRFGNGDATFITTQPLLANPLLPQFARPGDIFDGGIATNNTTGANGTMLVTGSLTGVLVFDNGGRSGATVAAQFPAAAGTQAQRFPMSAHAPGAATVEFRIALGEAGDAFRVPFTVRPLDITESVVETGATTSSATIPFSVDPNVDNSAGGLQLTLASTLLPEILVPAKDCFLFEYLPFAEPLSSRLMVAADLQILSKKYEQAVIAVNPTAEAAADMVELKKLQRTDGGFAWWPGQYDSDPYLTGYAAQALGRIQQAGLNTDPAMVADAHRYLTARLEDPDPHSWCRGYEPCIERMRFEAMRGLAALGDLSDKHVGEVYSQRDKFDLVTRIELARFMTALPAWKPQADEMARKIQELVYETGRYAALNTPEDLWWFDSVTKGQAEAVRLYAAQRYDAAITDRMVRSLLALRRKGSWANSYDDAQALDALIDYAGLESEPPAFTAVATLKGVQVANPTFLGYRDSVRDEFVPTVLLPRGRSDLVLNKGGTGTLHYIVSYSYRLHGPQPGAEAGLLVSRDVRPVGKDAVVAHMGLAKPANATTLPAAQVFEVGLTIIADHPVNQVIIVDPLPAGMEAIDTTFNTTPQSQSAHYGAWQIDYQVIHHDRVVAFANYLAPGIYTMHYLSRTVTPGTYEWPGAQAYLEYAPEEFGRSSSTTLTIP